MVTQNRRQMVFSEVGWLAIYLIMNLKAKPSRSIVSISEYSVLMKIHRYYSRIATLVLLLAYLLVVLLRLIYYTYIIHL